MDRRNFLKTASDFGRLPPNTKESFRLPISSK